MDNNKKDSMILKKSRSLIYKNRGCYKCSSLKKVFCRKNITMEEFDKEIMSTQKDITILFDDLSKYISSLNFEDNLVSGLSNSLESTCHDCILSKKE